MFPDWLSQYAGVFNAFTAIATMLLWGVFLQLAYFGFRRQRRPRLLINRGRKKQDLDALCIISNMSAEAIFIEYLVAELETSQGSRTLDVTDLEQAYHEGDEEQNHGDKQRSLASGPVSEQSRQGPLKPGDLLHLGTFGDLIDRLLRAEGIGRRETRAAGSLKLRSLTVRLIATYRSEDTPVGAERRFDLINGEQYLTFAPRMADTRQLDSRLQRWRLRRMLKDFIAQRPDHYRLA